MLYPKPSSLPPQERERYVLETAKRLCEQWNFFPPQKFNRKSIEDYIKERDSYLKIKSDIIWTTSPSSLKSLLKSLLRSSWWSSLKPSIMSSLKSSRWSSYCSSIKSSLDSLGSSCWSSLESSLKSSIRSSLEPSRWSSSSFTPLRSSMMSSLRSFYGFLSWDIYYQFNENEAVKNFMKYLPEAYKSGLGFAVITDKKFYAIPMPKYHLNRQNRLHKDLSPAVIWADGEKEYWLNGVRCPEQVVMTIAEEINPKILLKENNVEVRREIVRKIGVERVCQKLNARIIDKYVCKERFPVIKEHYDERNNKWGAKIEGYCYREIEYELLLLCLGKDRSRPYLKMLNPSMGIYHIEGVPPNIQTVKKALEWRNNSNEEPNILT